MPGHCAVCKKPSTLICGGCKRLHYCGKDHQKIHWKESHKSECQPLFKLEENDKLGRHLVAVSHIKKGDVILQESPLSVGPKLVTEPLCLGCLLPCDRLSFHECDGCGFPLCSPKCQVSDYHMDECRVMMEADYRAAIEFSSAKKEMNYFFIAPLRCLLLSEKSPDKYKKLMTLQSHLKYRMDQPFFAIYKQISGFLTKRLKRTDFSEEDILTVAAILDTNAFEIRKNNAKFRGAYHMASMLAHNCKPNTKHSFLFPEMTIVVTATTDIAPGEIIYATYTQTFWDTLARREHLKMAKCFECDCERCSDPTELGTHASSIRCVKCAAEGSREFGPFILAAEPLKADSKWVCQSCGREMTSKQIRSGNKSIKEEWSVREMRTVEGLESILDKYGVYGNGVLHPNNFNAVQIKHALIQLIGNDKEAQYSDVSDELLNRKIEYCHELLDFVDVVDPGYSRIRGEILNELQAAMVIQTKRDFNQEKITKEAAQKNLMAALTILKEVIEILKLDLDVDEFEGRLVALAKELDD